MDNERKVPVHVTLPAPMAAWLKCEAEHEMDNLSGVIQRHLLPAMQVPQTVWRDELMTVLECATTLDEARDLVRHVLGDMRWTTLRDQSSPCGPNTELVARIAADRLAVLRGQAAKRKGR